MASSFTKCMSCGKIFAAADSERNCPACRGEAGEPSLREQLRMVKSYIRDMMSRGEFITIAEAARGSEVAESRVWEFIQAGEIDLTPFNDPQVRNFLVNKRREQEKLRRDDSPKTPEPAPEKPSGFHGADKDKGER
ncbi:hypothetical protein IT575_13380 [bacterium]|nr:hypothetical protein [bacterium]